MNKFKYIVLFFFLMQMAASPLFAQNNPYTNGSAEWLVYRFFAENSFPDKDKYYTGEMVRDIKNPSVGEELNGVGVVTLRQVYQQPIFTVFAVNIKVGANTTGFYSYLLNVNGKWMIQAIRKFLLPKFIYQTVDSLSQVKQIPDSTAALYKMLKLMTATDEVIKTHLKKNVSLFNDLLGAFESKNKDNFIRLIDELGLNSVFKDRKYPNCTFVQIGSFKLMEVGYIKTEDDSHLPKISQNGFIYIEEIIPGWYIYRLL